ncbi:MAG: peptidyl-prolyl cis-trans isomerase (rotamase) - cyclophilin family [Clostridiales bacterium]|nr:peptidyl-prolyl cis-trans isomerase (rotamase) - cyclophilin family [Clostridiales bacterium]
MFKKTVIYISILVLIISLFSLAGCSQKSSSSEKETQVSIQTEKGEIVISLRPDLMPVTVDNFVGLVNKGFYNGLKFHRVEDWVIQGGDPKGNGTGGSDKKIKLETNSDLKNVKYAVAMARSQDPNSASSQFYILKKDANWLDGQYAVFGNVIKGKEVVDKITIGTKITKVEVVK